MLLVFVNTVANRVASRNRQIDQISNLMTDALALRGECHSTPEECEDTVKALDNMYWEEVLLSRKWGLQSDIVKALSLSAANLESEAKVVAKWTETGFCRGKAHCIFAATWDEGMKSVLGAATKFANGTISDKYFNAKDSNYCGILGVPDSAGECAKEEQIKSNIMGKALTRTWPSKTQHLRNTMGGQKLKDNLAAARAYLKSSSANTEAKTLQMSQGIALYLGSVHWAEVLTLKEWVDLATVLQPLLEKNTNEVMVAAEEWVEKGCLQYYYEVHRKDKCPK